MTDVSKGVKLKNLNFSDKVYWQETKAPEGYELSTKNMMLNLMKKTNTTQIQKLC